MTQTYIIISCIDRLNESCAWTKKWMHEWIAGWMKGWMDGCMVHIAPWVDSWQSESHAWMRPTPRPPPISASWRMNVYIYMWQFLNWFPIASFTRIYVGPEVFWNPKGFLVESRFWEWLYEDMQLFSAFLLAQKCFETLRDFYLNSYFRGDFKPEAIFQGFFSWPRSVTSFSSWVLLLKQLHSGSEIGMTTWNRNWCLEIGFGRVHVPSKALKT